MATLRLTIEGNFQALKRLETSMERLTKSTRLLASVSATVSGHFDRSIDRAQRLNRVLKSSRDSSQEAAKAAQGIRDRIEQATSSAQRLNRELRRAGGAQIRVPNVPSSTNSTGRNTILPSGNAVRRLGRDLERSLRRAGTGFRRSLDNAFRFGTRSSISLGRTLGGVGSAFSAVLTGGLSTVARLASGIAASLTRAVGSLASGLSRAAGGLAGGLTRAISSAISFIPRAIGTVTGPIGKALAGTVGFLTDAVGGALAAGFELAGSAVGALADSVSNLLGSAMEKVGGALSTALTVAAAGAAITIASSISQAIAQEPIADAFSSVTAARGIENQTALLERLRTATRGTIADVDLMRSANNALLLGAAQTGEQLEALALSARILGRAVGRSTTEAFERLVLAIGKGERRLLDEIGVVVRASDAQRELAAELGKTVASLNAQERQLAFQITVLEAARDKSKELGEQQRTTKGRIDELFAVVKNFRAELGGPFIESIGRTATAWARFIQGLDARSILEGARTGIRAIGEALRSIGNITLGEDLTSSLGGFGRAVVTLVTRPTSTAFELLKVRGLILWEDIKQRASEVWKDIVERVRQAATEIGRVIDQFIGKAILGAAKGFDSLASGIIPGAGFLSPTLDAVGGGVRPSATAAAGIGGQRRVLDQIGPDDEFERLGRNLDEAAEATKAVSNRMADLQARAAELQEAVTNQVAPTEKLVTSFEVLDTAVRQAQEHVRSIAAPIAQVNRIVGRETKEREDLIAKLKLESRARVAQIDRAKRDAEQQQRAFRASFDSVAPIAQERDFSTFVDQLRIAGESLGEFGDRLAFAKTFEERAKVLSDEFEQMSRRIDESAAELEQMPARFREASEALAKALEDAGRDFQKRLRDAAQSSLFGGEEFQTTRGRALQRRAERDRRRANKRLEQETLGSGSFRDFFGAANLSINGPFGIGRNDVSDGAFGIGDGGELNKPLAFVDDIRAALERFTAQRIDEQGRTLAGEFSETLQAIRESGAAELEELTKRKDELTTYLTEDRAAKEGIRDAISELIATEGVARAQELNDEIKALSEQARVEAERTAAADEALTAQIAELNEIQKRANTLGAQANETQGQLLAAQTEFREQNNGLNAEQNEKMQAILNVVQLQAQDLVNLRDELRRIVTRRQ